MKVDILLSYDYLESGLEVSFLKTRLKKEQSKMGLKAGEGFITAFLQWEPPLLKTGNMFYVLSDEKITPHQAREYVDKILGHRSIV